MKESELLFQVSRIVSATYSFASALDRIGALLRQALEERSLTIELADSRSSRPKPAHRFSFPIVLRASGKKLGELMLHCNQPGFDASVSHRVFRYIGEQLGALFERSYLSSHGAQLAAELADLRRNLETRKALQRALGLLVAQRGMTADSAQSWISERARDSRLSIQQVAEQITLEESADHQTFNIPWEYRRIPRKRNRYMDVKGVLVGPRQLAAARTR
jgi:hypothetical protein